MTRGFEAVRKGGSALSWAAMAGVALLVSPGVSAGEGPDDGIEWCVVGDPGNPDFRDDFNYPSERGGVDYVYRIAKKEMIAEQWLEFLNAYAPFADGREWEGRLEGDWINPAGGHRYILWIDGKETSSVARSWYLCARFCNWLHNGKVNEAWAFDDGAYDTSVFEAIDAWSYEGDYGHRPGARFWIPTVDELVKAAYWDPDRYGAGEGGYWTYPNASETPPISGLPEDGGETNTGDGIVALPEPDIADYIGLYPSVQSPWGLLDASGGQKEWAEWQGGDYDVAYKCGSAWGAPLHEIFDAIGTSVGDNSMRSAAGLRLASPMPCAADIAQPYGTLDTADVLAFLDAFWAGYAAAEFAPPRDRRDIDDVLKFLETFAAGCP